MTEVSCLQDSDEQSHGRRQILVELSEDVVRTLVAVGDRPRHALCDCADYPLSERPCRFCAGMPVSPDALVQIRGSLQRALEAVPSQDPGGVRQGCPIHQGVLHGGEAEALRSGIEAIMAYGDTSMTELQALLDHVDSLDSLGYLERIDLATGIATLIRDENLTAGALRAKLQELLDGVS